MVDGGASTVNLNAGMMNVAGSFQVDHLTLASGGDATLTLTDFGAMHAVTGAIVDGGGVSTFNVDGGTMTVGGGLSVDSLRVGHISSALTGHTTLTVSGGDVTIGPSGNLDIGRRTYGTGVTTEFQSTLDLRAASSVVIDVDNVWLGLAQNYSGQNVGTGNAVAGFLRLSEAGDNTIHADQILLGDVPLGMGASYSASRITFGGATNTVRSDLMVLGGLKGQGEAVILAGGTLDIRGLTGAETNLYIANNNLATSVHGSGKLDMSAGTLNAAFDEVVVGRFGGSTNGSGRGTLIIGDGDVAANVLRLAISNSSNSADLTYGIVQMVHNEGLFMVAGSVTDGGGVGHLQIDAGTFSVAADMNVDNLRVGLNGGTALLDLTGAIGTHSVVNSVTIAGDAGSVGTIRMAGGTFILPALTDGGGTSNLELPNGTMTVGGDFAVDNVLVGSNGGTAVLDIDGAVVIGSGADSALDVAVVTGSGTDGGTGTLDLAGATSVAINVGTVRIANSGNGVSSTGTVHLSGGANTIRADEIVVGNRKSSATVDMAAGGSLDIQGQTVARANLSIGVNDINTGSTPLATLDATAGAFTAQLDQLVLGYKSGSSLTGTGNGELLLGTNAANNVSAKDVVIAYQSGTGSATGLLQMQGGTFAVSGSVSDGGGVSTIQLDGGTMTVANGLQVDNLRVGYGGLSANLTVNGGPVLIGTGTEMLDIGYRGDVSGGSTVGTVDFSQAASVNIDVAQVRVAQVPTTGGETGGTLILPDTGPVSIRATEISLGDIPSASGGLLASLQLGGGTTDIAVDHFYVSRRKKSGEVTIEAGGELNLVGRLGAEANLYIGYNDVHTAGETTGTMDLTGSTFNAELDNLIVGYHYRPSVSNEIVRGSGTGVLTFDAGAVSANSVVVGSGHASHDGRGYGTINMNGGFWTADAITLGAGNANTRGTFNLAGGTLDAGSIGQGVSGSTVAFNFTGGTLHVDQFGSSSLPLNLLQQGGTLAPGHSVGTTALFGDYTQEELGTLEIEIAGLGDHDLVTVDGNASLDGTLDVVLLGGYTAELGDYFDVLTTTGDLTLGTLAVAGDPPQPNVWLVGCRGG